MPAANTRECFSASIGQKVVGVLYDALPISSDVRHGTKALVFEDGRALVISSQGSYWIETAEEIRSAVARRRVELERTQGELAEVIALAGV